MKRITRFSLCLLTLALASCGYRMGGVVNPKMEGMKTFSISMFDNHTTYPNVAFQVTTAASSELQADGAFRMAPASSADFTVSGAVTDVSYERLLVDSEDTYISLEIGVTVSVDYKVTDNRNGEVIMHGTVNGEGSYFNTGGNTQAGRDAALSYASRKAAELIVDNLST